MTGKLPHLLEEKYRKITPVTCDLSGRK